MQTLCKSDVAHYAHALKVQMVQAGTGYSNSVAQGC